MSAKAKTYAEWSREGETRLRYRRRHSFSDPVVRNLVLTARVWNCLWQEMMKRSPHRLDGICSATLDDICAHSMSDWGRAYNFGKASFDELSSEVERFGYKLARAEARKKPRAEKRSPYAWFTPVHTATVLAEDGTAFRHPCNQAG